MMTTVYRAICGACISTDSVRFEAREKGAFKSIDENALQFLLNVAAFSMAIAGVVVGDSVNKNTVYRIFEFTLQCLGLIYSVALAYCKSKELENVLRRKEEPGKLRNMADHKDRCFYNGSPTILGNVAGLVLSGVGIWGGVDQESIKGVLTVIGPFLASSATTFNISSLDAEITYASGRPDVAPAPAAAAPAAPAAAACSCC